MTAGELVATAVGVVVGFAVAVIALAVALRAAPAALMRDNVSGRRVPAVLGLPLCAGALSSIFSASVVRSMSGSVVSLRVEGVIALVVIVMFFAGLIDDLRGNESSRGFSGHFGALKSGALTGGIVKLVAGAAAGLLAGSILSNSVAAILGIAALVALSANLVNLLDRAPGRAGKVAGAGALLLVVFGSDAWVLGAAGLVGALVTVLPFDLSERAMLGDAGANPLGAALGLGLATSLGEPARWGAVAVLLVLNLASERYSFSAAIERTPWLRAIDRIGRK